ncbi:hypothetical protein [Brachybacterium kimchii]|uniref:HNH endonuclease n=1 Tax=Brachybacterium kimchii TaxID=2942909 RepID=A0ABY4N7Z8_9MICO|nr:hypothetical protein [Brachybacterium kimchii]UQN30681.1 hypothetical protein M4486_05095 [Brachybacterium kimchii]
MSDHGTRSHYRAGCRCDDCRAANAAYDRAYRAGHREHGTRAAYTRGCRCDACRSANAEAHRAWRAAHGATPRISQEEIEYRLDELEHLLEGSVYPPEACARVGWKVDAAERYASINGRDSVASRLAGVNA